jgi:hypothetical protein
MYIFCKKHSLYYQECLHCAGTREARKDYGDRENTNESWEGLTRSETSASVTVCGNRMHLAAAIDSGPKPHGLYCIGCYLSKFSMVGEELQTPYHTGPHKFELPSRTTTLQIAQFGSH